MQVQTDVPLAGFTTLRVGGPARRLVTVHTADELVDTVAACDRSGEPVLLLGGGSNLLVADAGFDGTVVRIMTSGCSVQREGGDVTVTVAAGEPWDGLVARLVAGGYGGVEALSGIPGSTGATPVQNVGAYGQEVAQTVTAVRVWDRRHRSAHTVGNADCGFGYRTSRFKGSDRHVVLEVTFRLRVDPCGSPVSYPELARALGIDVGERASLAAVRAAVLGLRAGKGMVLAGEDPDTWSAGSFFTNPVLAASVAARLPDDAPRWPLPDGRVKTSAAWLIERAGYGRGYGGPVARLSTKHTLAVTNRGGATAADLLALAREVRGGVHAAFGVTLVNEPVVVGAQL